MNCIMGSVKKANGHIASKNVLPPVTFIWYVKRLFPSHISQMANAATK